MKRVNDASSRPGDFARSRLAPNRRQNAALFAVFAAISKLVGRGRRTRRKKTARAAPAPCPGTTALPNYRFLTPCFPAQKPSCQLPGFDASVLHRFRFLFSEFCLLFSRRQNPVVCTRRNMPEMQASKTGSWRKKNFRRFRVRAARRMVMISREELTMKIRTNKNGFTLWEAIAIVVVLVILAAVLLSIEINPIDHAPGTVLKRHGRGIWAAIITANSERAPLGLPLVWPQEMSFTGTNTSTAYFQRLMADTNGVATTNINAQLVSDLTVWELAGAGVSSAPSPSNFKAANNAWCVTCVGTNTPPETTFLFTRNLDVGAVLCSTSRPTFVSSELALKHRAIWVTMNGACLEAREKYLTTADLLVPSNCPPVAVMRP
jgi:hypothetical protein